MLLMDDTAKSVVEPMADKTSDMKKLYDFDLMQNAGHIEGYALNKSDVEAVHNALADIYNASEDGLLFAVGDGNHSLASAKECYRQGVAPRYALVEIVNIHDSSLEFEPIYRVVFGVDVDEFKRELNSYVSSLCGGADEQKMVLVCGDKEEEIVAKSPVSQLTVGTVQAFLDGYIKTHEGASVDYIHGIESTRALAKWENTVGILFDGMGKDELFKTVICDGALPRKTFSMGHAADKRFYIECRKIR
jgi:uncharacterized protein (DUF1015 family)